MAATGAKTEDPPKTPDIKVRTEFDIDGKYLKKRNWNDQKEAKDDSFGFECNICLTAAQKPVVTLCGHLYCWPCLYKWLNHSKKGECPVCKGGVTTNNVIPIYGRGRHSDPRKSTLSVPERPRAHRSASSPTHVEARSIARSIHLPIRSDAGGMSAGFGLFPSLFGSNTVSNVTDLSIAIPNPPVLAAGRPCGARCD